MHQHLTSLKTEFHRSRNLFFIVFVFCMATVFSFVATSNSRRSQAADAGAFQAGNIISDAVMGNYNSMTVTDIQNFLDSKNQCNNQDYNQYLELSNRYPNITWHWEGEPSSGHFVCLAQEKFGDTASEIGEGQTAAEIIYAAAQDNRINPQVLLVLLQKESSLITDKVPNSLDYSKATGYGCPDTAACDKKYSGFKNQIYRAAELFRYTLDNGSISFPEGRSVYVGYHPSSSCGGSQVFITNRATAALYRYTPYQPNTAALNAGYGTGDICSAYGNRNFYLYFTDWFGSTQAKVDGEVLVIPEGTYSFTSAIKNNYALGVVGDNVELAATQNDNDSQRWQLARDGETNYYTLTNLATGKRLDLSSATEDANVQVWSANSSCDQLWKIYRTSDNYLTLESACSSGMVLSLPSATAQAGTNVQAGITKGSSSQKWALRTGMTITEGNYAITSSRDTRYGLDIEEARTTSGGNVHFWTFLGYYNQLWHFQYLADTDEYVISNPYSGLNLDISAANYSSGTNIQTWEHNNTCAQRWKVAKTTDGNFYLIASCNYNYSVDLKNDPADGNNIQLWQTNDTPNQKWSLLPANQGEVDDGIYTIANKVVDQSALDIVEARTNSGANVYLWNLHGHYNQLWRVTYNVGSDDYTIINPRSGHSLDLSTGITEENRNVQIWENNNTCAQRWNITKTADDGYYHISSVCNPDYVLDCTGSPVIAGSNLVIKSATTSESQKWYFRPLH